MIPTAALAILGGLCMIGFYSWNVSVTDCDDYEIDESKGKWEEENPELCKTLSISTMFTMFIILFDCLKKVNGEWHPISCSSSSDV